MSKVREIAEQTDLVSALLQEAKEHLRESRRLRDSRETEAGAFAHVKVAAAMLELADWLQGGKT